MPVAIFVIHNPFMFIQRYSGNFKVENFCEYLWSKGNGLLVAVRGKQKQVDHLRNEVEELKHQLDAERAKNDTLKAKITAYQKNDLSAVKKVEARYEEQLRILNEQIRDYEQMKPELERLRNFFFEQNIGADESDVQAVESDKQEEIAKYKIITVGGHEQLRKNIKDAYPSIMVLDGTPKSQDFHPVENSDYVFILTQHISHGRRCHRTTIVFKKFCITTRTRQGRSKPFLERKGVGFFVFGGVPRRTTKASAAHGRAASAQAQCAADAYFLCCAPSPDGKVRVSAAF